MALRVAILLCACVATLAISVPIAKRCDRLHEDAGLSNSYCENVAHAIHSMTVQGLRLYNPRATKQNQVPTVNHNVSAPNKVIPYAPDDPTGSDFSTRAMNVFDKVMSNIGKGNDGLGPLWSPIERIAHNFHMWDLWVRIQGVYQNTVIPSPPRDDTCSCLLDTHSNGVYAAVKWVADHYKSGTPITLLDRPISKLSDADTWAMWKDRLLYYYTKPALYDAALYLHCATKNY